MATLRISLRAGERIFVNGAVLKFDRKTSLEFMNDVTFLLESHVIQPEDATTPLRQLYYTLQVMLVDPASAESARTLFDEQIVALMRAFSNPLILQTLEDVADLVARHRVYESMKLIRGQFAAEKEILSAGAMDAEGSFAQERRQRLHVRARELALEKAS